VKVFITGGNGLIGSAVVAELLSNGHTVLALARSDASAQALQSAGAEPLRGDLADLDTLRAGAAQADGVIHLAFDHNFSTPEAVAQAVAGETAALTTLGEALLGSDRPLVTVSGTRGFPAASPPKPTHCRLSGRSAVAASPSGRFSA
jgi:nucleoside-diphosphate-sugar epimerase